ncbi:MAG: RdgB/HAM1 family non-canonical purine NTP pyrophosphatase [Bacteroidales bacterium]|nr:RdgB/HAM1 family non-canonical purine NTP pyrophosphatase [Bacteroidales bacterium]
MELIFATNNLHKLHEVKEKLQLNNAKIQVISLSEIGFFNDIPETGITLQANALQKAQTIFDFCGKNCFADDTGLEIVALNGEPGVYSARYAERCWGEPCGRPSGSGVNPVPTFDDNINLVLSKLHGKINRKAYFKTVIALFWNGKIHYFEGRIDGEITSEKHGTEGFGYDPIFRPEGYQETFAELPLDEKNRISHRARAVDELVKFLSER